MRENETCICSLLLLLLPLFELLNPVRRKVAERDDLMRPDLDFGGPVAHDHAVRHRADTGRAGHWSPIWSMASSMSSRRASAWVRRTMTRCGPPVIVRTASPLRSVMRFTDGRIRMGVLIGAAPRCGAPCGGWRVEATRHVRHGAPPCAGQWSFVRGGLWTWGPFVVRAVVARCR